MSLSRKIIKLFWDDNEYVIYKYNKEKQGIGICCPEVEVYQNLNEVPMQFKDKAFKGLQSLLMKRRLEMSSTKLMGYIDDGEMIAYGWLQSGMFFRKKFGWMLKGATMLGPYWVNPDYRGKGIYGKMLQHSILENDGKEALIYTHPNNIPSQKGIEKAKFQFLGTFRLILVLRMFLIKNEVGTS